jgi:hypothetical protein
VVRVDVLKAWEASMASQGRYWFPAKRYGWGWGLPRTWEGWLVLTIFLVLVVAGVWLFPPVAMPVFFVTYILVLDALLIGVCWLTGEPPRWRWGGDGNGRT